MTLLRDGTRSLLDGQRLVARDLQGAHHDGMGYAFLAPGEAVVKAASQSGTWTSIEERSSRHEPVTQDVFSLWIDHGPRARDAQYAYVVVPGVTPDGFAGFLEDVPVRILANRLDLQAVLFPGQGLVQAVFYEAGAVEVSGESRARVNAPCLLMLQTGKDSVDLSVADPTQTLEKLQVRLNGRYGGAGCMYLAEENVTTVTVDLPSGGFAGKTVQIALRAE